MAKKPAHRALFRTVAVTQWALPVLGVPAPDPLLVEPEPLVVLDSEPELPVVPVPGAAVGFSLSLLGTLSCDELGVLGGRSFD